MKLWRELLLLPVAALACALVSNAMARPERRLAWRGRPLPTPNVSPIPERQPKEVLPPPPSPPPQPAAAAPTKTALATAVVQKAMPTPIAETKVSTTGAASPFAEIDSEAAWKAHQAGARFLDARRTADYRSGHIAGAWCAPVWESDLDAHLTAFEAGSGASYTDLLVLYCGGGDCQDSHLLAGRLLALGYRNLRIYRDGYPDWTAKERPVRKGPER